MYPCLLYHIPSPLSPTAMVHLLNYCYTTSRRIGPFGAAIYGTDFVALRDRSVSEGSMFAFKQVEDDTCIQWWYKADLTDYVAIAFGKLEEFWDKVRGYFSVGAGLTIPE